MQFFKGNNPQVQSVIKRGIALGVMSVLTAGSIVSVAAATRNAKIDYDGSQKTVQLLSSNTQDILKEAGIQPGSNDLVLRSEAQTDGTILLEVKSGYNVTVAADGTTKKVTAHFGDTVADALKQAGVTLGADDLVEPAGSTKVSDGMQISVIRKYHVTVAADGKSVPTLVTEGTVSAALKAAGVDVGGDDIVTPSEETPVGEGMQIAVQRVTFKEVTAAQPVAFASTQVNDGTLYKGETKLKVQGRNGVRTIVSRQKLVDGKMISSQALSTAVTQQPVSQVTLVGTKSRPAGTANISGNGTVTDHNGNTVNYRRCVSGRCTAYSGGGWTSTGRPAAFGLIAVNPSIIPYGSRLYICSPDGRTVYGYAIAADTGTGVMTGRILADLYYPSNSQCRNFGVRNMNIYVL